MSSVERQPGQVGAAEKLLRSSARPGSVQLFAVDPDMVQICWTEGAHPPVRARLGDRTWELDSACTPSGAGSALIDALRPATRYELEFSCSTSGGPRTSVLRFRTPAAPPGEELFRFATISDLHLGRGVKDFKGPFAHLNGNAGHLSVDDVSSPTAGLQLQLARSAVDEAIAWGAQHLVLKGDVCDQSYDWVWDQAARLVGDLPIPVSIIPGNHDTGRLRLLEPELATRERGMHLTRGTESVDLPGMTLVLVDSTVPGTSWGALDRSAEDVADLATSARRSGRGVAVMTHHHAQRFAVPLFWPHGIPGPNANRFAGALAKAAPDALVSSGHTHRCRVRKVEGIAWSEVSATSQFPGVWAGYVVHEGGLRQTVHRISEPDSLDQIEFGRSLLNGVWAMWSTGTLSDRCFTIPWDNR